MRFGEQLVLQDLTDPRRDLALKAPRTIGDQLEPVTGDPAFDPDEIDAAARQLNLPAGRSIKDRLLERVIRVGLAHIDATFQGDHPKYGVGHYADERHDAFPPTIIAAVDALAAWGMVPRAEQLLTYWLNNFVKSDGAIDYYGPSLSEYGQLLTTAAGLASRGAGSDWLTRHHQVLTGLADHVAAQINAGGAVALVSGIPEADETGRPATYFHNNVWLVRGLRDWADCADQPKYRATADALCNVLLEAIEATWPADPNNWWLRPTVEKLTDADYESESNVRDHTTKETGEDLLQPVVMTCQGSYTNYRYWPELLSSDVLPRHWMQRIVDARLAGGGQFAGCTRFWHILDNWPMMDYLEGLWTLGRVEDFKLSMWGHIFCHQERTHLTAYEQVSLPPGKECAPYCLPCQLVAVRAAAKLVNV